MRFLIRIILRRSLAMVIGAAVVTLPCLYWTGRLYGNVRPDIEELLPRQSRSIQDLSEIRRRMQAIQNLGILIFTEDADAGKRFSVDLAARLQKLPPTVAAGVEYRIDKELRFFDSRKALFVSVDDLEQIKNFIKARISYEKQLYNPLTFLGNVELPEPKLDFPALMNKYAAKSASFSQFPDGFYATSDGKLRALLVYLPADNSGIAGVFKLKESVKDIVDHMDLKSYSPSLSVDYTGDVQNTIEEFSALLQDIERSAEIVFALVAFFLWLYFRSVIAVGALLFSLFMARFWTFGVSWFLVGYLNANSAFMGSLLLGSGITFGVMLLSRYLEERRLGRIPVRAAWLAVDRTMRATSTAALAAGMAYGSLFLTRFEGFRQYGIIGFVGMVLCWLSSVLVLPAVLVQIERIRPIIKPGTKARKPWIFGPLSRFVGASPKPIVLAFGILTALSIAVLPRFNADRIIETNLANLRNKESMESGSGYRCKYLDQIFHRFLTPLALLTHDASEAERVAQALREEQKQGEGAKLISSVNTMQQFVPEDQSKKVSVLEQIRGVLPPSIMSRLPAADRKRIDSFLTPEAFHPFTQKELPHLVLDKFTEKDGSIGKLVLVEPPVDSASWSGHELNEFVRILRDTGDKIAGRTVPVAGGLPVVSDMIQAISEDGPKATIFAFLSVVALIIVFFRKPSVVSLMLFALVLGSLWLFGFILGTGFKINFLNFIAFPITFGIGIDYGVNVFHRYLRDPDHNIVTVIRETGGAVGLCSLTTIIGYSSLIIARNQAFVSFGVLAVIGEITSLAAAVVALPALLLMLQRLRAPARQRQSAIGRRSK
jgi:predicted RND superfamily exporter protein